MKLISITIEEFSNVLGSNAPAPGGGSVSALAGALAADLVSMVCSLSIGKEKYEDYQDVLKESYRKVQTLSKSLLERVDLDTEAFNGVMAAFKLPKETEEEKRMRSEAIKEGFKEAVDSPLNIATECLEVLQVAESLIGKFNTNAMSDFGVAGQQAYAGLQGAVMNIQINLPSIKDEAYVAEMRRTVQRLLEEGTTVHTSVHSYVSEQLG